MNSKLPDHLRVITRLNDNLSSAAPDEAFHKLVYKELPEQYWKSVAVFVSRVKNLRKTNTADRRGFPLIINPGGECYRLPFSIVGCNFLMNN